MGLEPWAESASIVVVTICWDGNLQKKDFKKKRKKTRFRPRKQDFKKIDNNQEKRRKEMEESIISISIFLE